MPGKGRPRTPRPGNGKDSSNTRIWKGQEGPFLKPAGARPCHTSIPDLWAPGQRAARPALLARGPGPASAGRSCMGSRDP